MTKPDTQTVTMSYEFPFPPAKVWRALTEPKLLAAWLMDTDMEAVLGHSFTFRSEPSPWWDGIVHCQVLELVPHERLSYTWGGGPAQSPLDTVVTWTLTPTDRGTRLSLEHSGFVPKNKFAYEGARDGWARNLDQRLRALLEQASS